VRQVLSQALKRVRDRLMALHMLDANLAVWIQAPPLPLS